MPNHVAPDPVYKFLNGMAIDHEPAAGSPDLTAILMTQTFSFLLTKNFVVVVKIKEPDALNLAWPSRHSFLLVQAADRDHDSPSDRR